MLKIHCKTVLSLTRESSYLGKTVFILTWWVGDTIFITKWPVVGKRILTDAVRSRYITVIFL